MNHSEIGKLKLSFFNSSDLRGFESKFFQQFLVNMLPRWIRIFLRIRLQEAEIRTQRIWIRILNIE